MDGKVAKSMRELLERPPRSALPSAPASAGRISEEEEYVAFANGRLGTRAQLMIVFQKADGSLKAFSYTHLCGVESDNPSTGFTVIFTSAKKVLVRGRNLQRLFQLLCLHKVAEVVEASRHEQLQSNPDLLLVESIQFADEGRFRT